MHARVPPVTLPPPLSAVSLAEVPRDVRAALYTFDTGCSSDKGESSGVRATKRRADDAFRIARHVFARIIPILGCTLGPFCPFRTPAMPFLLYSAAAMPITVSTACSSVFLPLASHGRDCLGPSSRVGAVRALHMPMEPPPRVFISDW